MTLPQAPLPLIRATQMEAAQLEFWMVTFSGLALSYLLQPVLQLERLPQCPSILPVTTEWNSLFPVQSFFQVYYYVLLVPTHLLGCGLSLGLGNNQYC